MIINNTKIKIILVLFSGVLLCLPNFSWAVGQYQSVTETLDKLEGFKYSQNTSNVPGASRTQGSRDYVVEDMNRQFALPAVTPQPKSKKPQIMLDVLELKDMDIADVLKLISKKTGLNIVAGQGVKGKVTIYLKDVEVREALRIILQANDMAFEEGEGVIYVMTDKDFEKMKGYKFGETIQTRVVKLAYANVADVLLLINQIKSSSGKIISNGKSDTIVLMDNPDKLAMMEMIIKEIDIPIETKVFNLSYAKAPDLQGQLTESLTPNVGKVRADERSNKIIVTDTPAKISQIQQIIEAFDVKQKEVLIEAKILQIVLSDEYKLGVDWGGIVSDYHNLDLISDFDILGSTEKRGKASIGPVSSDRLSVGTLSAGDYSILLEALETVGVTNILSSPKITTINNQEAKILVGSTEPYVTSTVTTPATGPTTTAESVNFIEVGVKLYVTPTIHHDDFITMKIKPEVSSVTQTLTTSNNNQIPIVETSQAETTVSVKDNVTIVIGGLIKEVKIDSIKKIPLLGDIPFLGFAFRNESQNLEKTELVIFLTPRIISGDAADNQTVMRGR